MLTQGRDLTPSVPAVILPMPPGAVWYGVWILFKLLTSEGRNKPLWGKRIPCLASPERFPGPGRVKLSTSIAGIRRDAIQNCSIPSSCRHSDRHITVPPFEGETQESELIAFCGRSPLLDIRYVLADIFFFWGGVKLIVSPGVICSSITF